MGLIAFNRRPDSGYRVFHPRFFRYLQPEIFRNSANSGRIERYASGIDSRDQLSGASNFSRRVVMRLEPIQQARDECIHAGLIKIGAG